MYEAHHVPAHLLPQARCIVLQPADCLGGEPRRECREVTCGELLGGVARAGDLKMRGGQVCWLVQVDGSPAGRARWGRRAAAGHRRRRREEDGDGFGGVGRHVEGDGRGSSGRSCWISG